MKVSKNFSAEEFVCKCGCGLGLPSEELVRSLEELRKLLGKPIRINSGARCLKHNKAVGGAAKSQHVVTIEKPECQAVDIEVVACSAAELFVLAEQVASFRCGGMGYYPEEQFLHVDVRQHRARWCRLDGKYLRIEEAFRAAGCEVDHSRYLR